ncbi:MAG TPA: acetoacetate decarboxylase family protein [Syntrophorhabdaceae bacterium]|nr:acetoacetate decarboxylase family protein [Syntrophorhabdaceae bacterium]HPA07232.1 acetoacetate decarboxylase family protein [Methanoregulaceae archaeon]
MMNITEQEFNNFLEGLEFREIVIPSTGEVSTMPLTSFNNVSMTGVYTATRSKVMRLILNPSIVPADLGDNKTLITMTAIEYANRNIPPYNEIIVGFLVNIGKKAAPPTVESLLQPNFGGSYLYIHHLIVDTRLAEILGNEILGYNKFMSTIEFSETEQSRTCVVSEAGQEMFRFTVYPEVDNGGYDYDKDTNTVATYKNGKINLLSYPIAVKLPKNQPKKSKLTFGPHPLGKILFNLDISEQPLGIKYSRDWRLYSDERNLKTVEP